MLFLPVFGNMAQKFSDFMKIELLGSTFCRFVRRGAQEGASLEIARWGLRRGIWDFQEGASTPLATPCLHVWLGLNPCPQGDIQLFVRLKIRPCQRPLRVVDIGSSWGGHPIGYPLLVLGASSGQSYG